MTDPPSAPDEPLWRNAPLVLVVAVGTLTSTVRWLEMLAVGVYVFDRTGSALLVTFMAMLRMLPMALCGAFVGALAERLQRRPVMLASLSAMCALSTLVALLAAADRLAVWHLAVSAFVGGLFWTTDYPVRRTIISDVVPAPRLASAMSLDVLTNNSSRMLGPLLGGVLLQAVGMAGAFILSAGLYGLGIALMYRVRHQDTPRPSHLGVLARLAEGLRYLAGNRALIGLLAITVIFNVFGFPFLSLVPVVGRDDLALSASSIGLLAAMEGAGVLVGASGLMLWARPQHYGHYYIAGLAIFLLSALLFAGSRWPPLSAAALLASGLGGAGFSAMQSTLLLLCTPPAARTRMMGVLMVCIGTAPLGFLHVGWLADTLGAPAAIATTAAEGLLALLIATRVWPEVLAPQAPR